MEKQFYVTDLPEVFCNKVRSDFLYEDVFPLLAFEMAYPQPISFNFEQAMLEVSSAITELVLI